MKLIDEWKLELRRLWSARIAMFWCVIGAVLFVAPLVSDEAKALLGTWVFGSVLFLAATSFLMARFLKQPGAEQL